MADLDNIKDVVLNYADLYAAALRQSAPRDTGRLASSYRASVSEKEGKLQMQIFGEYYGPFQSFGVGPGALAVPEGVNPRPLSEPTYKFRDPSRVLPVNQSKGNFMGNAVSQVTPRFAQALEEAGVKDVEEFFDSLSKIEVK